MDRTQGIKAKEQALATTTETLPAQSAGDSMLAKVLSDPDRLTALPIETLERLIELRGRMQAEEARRHYFDALAAFQAVCPTIERDKGIPDRNGIIKYWYAPLEHIAEQVAGPLREHGFSYRFETEPTNGGVAVSCITHHEAGHSERSTIVVPGVQVPQANAAQNSGAGVTYGKRLSFLNAFGIMTADQDTDARNGEREPHAGPAVITAEQAADLESLIAEVGADMDRFLVWGRVESLEQLPAERYSQAVAMLERKRKGV